MQHESKREKNRRDLIEDLKSSIDKIGRLYPILEDFYGNVIDGQHRLEADEKWPKMRLNSVRTEKDRILARLISNVCRRTVQAKEKRIMLSELGEILLEEGMQPGEISKAIVELTGMSYRWVMKYLPEKFKDYYQSERASLAARHAAQREWLKPLKPGDKLVEVTKYVNTKFALYMVNLCFHKKIERTAQLLNTTPDIFIQSVIEEKIKEIQSFYRMDIETLRRAPPRRKKMAMPRKYYQVSQAPSL
jgi:hypothetical protein